jgi:hypothetical protein
MDARGHWVPRVGWADDQARLEGQTAMCNGTLHTMLCTDDVSYLGIGSSSGGTSNMMMLQLSALQGL